MPRTREFKVRVERKLTWRFVVEATDEERAREIADRMADEEPPHDDIAWATEIEP